MKRSHSIFFSPSFAKIPLFFSPTVCLNINKSFAHVPHPALRDHRLQRNVRRREGHAGETLVTLVQLKTAKRKRRGNNLDFVFLF